MGGIAIDVAAYAMGAQWIERHFTKDRTWKGTDHAASLETAGLTKLVRDLGAMYTSLTYKKEDILDLEKEMRAKLKWGFYNKAVVEGKKQGCSSVRVDARTMALVLSLVSLLYFACSLSGRRVGRT